MSTKTYKGYGALLLSTFLYGWFGVFVKLIGSSIPVFYQSFFRDTLGAIVLFVIFRAVKYRLTKPNKKDAFWIIGRSMLGSIAFVTSFIAFDQISIALAYIFFYAGVVIGGFIMGSLFNHEKITPTKIAALGMVLMGIVFAYAFKIEKSGSLIFVLFAFVSGLLTACWNVFSQQIKGNHTSMELNFYDFVIAAVFNMLVSLLITEQWVAPVISMPWIATIGFTLMFLATGYLMTFGFRHMEAQIGSIIMPLEIVFGIALGFVVLRDPVSLSMIVGSILIMCAAMLPYVAELRHTKRNLLQ